ncbi:Metallo-hydrolase/oxidoreductase [Mytilinidion resinicola]|uniref:Metallo-hydrolase/oxidoreductase n=1 Tax=Mytilinidion resinicola TaxID=574789 RepID=A0A6A6YD64_9PEZI|nr:Metallo-hydrolase/oxidoreductase [Mytilinidion resinicola]KAF2806035.1 Metallo-hydrolase/oxidoreductase [Mytilinidion resinicola]
MLKARWGANRNFVPVPADASQLVAVRPPDFGAQLPHSLKATWIGHASFVVEAPAPRGGGGGAGATRGVRLLLDPVWSRAVGPYGQFGPVRFVGLPCAVEDVGEVDAVLVSHDHYDHLDAQTLRRVRERGGGRVRFLVALGVKQTLVGLGVGIRAEEVVELDWWGGVRVEVEGVGGVEVVCTPAQHGSGRTPWGFFGTLWCSWVIQEVLSGGAASVSEEDGAEKQRIGKKLYFTGDTGYCCVHSDAELSSAHSPVPPCPAFAEIGQLYGPFDLALLPIGCYLPRTFMSSQHSSPDDSISIHKDVRSEKSIGMHYGTFRGNLSAHHEPVTEPPVRWRKACEEAGLEWGAEIGLCDIGETVAV